jgi:hypothetical protein
MPYSVNGIGTKYYGKAERWPDGSYITTKWIVLFFVPILPLGSFRVKRISGDGFFRGEYLVEEVGLHNRQVTTTYAILASLSIAIYLLVKFT